MSDCDGSPFTSSSSSRRFELADIQSATDNFADELVIGQGGFGKVYKGSITDGETMTVAVKRLNPRSRQGAREFRTEIEMLSRFRYRYLVSLIGYCDEPDEMILVYEYMPRGNFADHLHRSGKNYSAPLPWLRRLRICIDAARGLDYLHTGTSIQPDRAIHRDVKSSNILLDDNWDAKISDFGLSRLGPEDRTYSHVSTDVKGTRGYLDPDYNLTGRLTRKSDVYAFGVVLLEALCGRPAVDLSADEEQWGLAGWAQYCIREGTVDEIIDPSEREEIKKDCLMEFVQIADECLHHFPRKRPTMAEVVVRLEFAVAMQEGKDSSIVVKPAKMPLTLHEGEDSSDVVKPAKMTFTRKVQRYFSSRGTSESKVNTESDNKSIRPNEGGDSIQEVPPSGQSLTEKLNQPCFKKFSFAELKGMTENFSRDLVLGEGGFGMAFKGAINEVTYSPAKAGTGMAVAVKRFNLDLLEGVKRDKPEVVHFQKLIHPNLVKMFGYCLEDEEFLLVYEYMKHGSLDNYLIKKDADAPLPWATRLKIVVGAAQGLAFLHLNTKQVMYFDLKASNVLLDKDFNAKLCDFGLAELDQLANENVDHNDVGSSYSEAGVNSMYQSSVAPEYLESGCVMIFMELEILDAGDGNMDRDVHGFGLILLQVLTGQKIDRKHGRYSVDWGTVARKYLSDEKMLVNIMDARLEHEYPSRGASQVAELTLKCLDNDPRKRPSMTEVLKDLKRISATKMEPMEEVR
ncbi:hypothetical protein RJ640_028910, partial [Escallonia rubra]